MCFHQMGSTGEKNVSFEQKAEMSCRRRGGYRYELSAFCSLGWGGVVGGVDVISVRACLNIQSAASGISLGKNNPS